MRFVVLAAALLVIGPSARADEPPRDPSFVHGAGEVVMGLVVEFPETVIDATLTGPPVAGTLVGIFAGVSQALRRVTAGAVEMAQGFDPWGSKRSSR